MKRLYAVFIVMCISMNVGAQCPIINANINPNGSDGNNEFIFMTNTSGATLTTCDIAVGTVFPDDATVDVDAYGNDAGIIGNFDYTNSWNCGNTLPTNTSEACGSGLNCYGWLSVGDPATDIVVDSLNSLCPGPATFVAVTSAGIPAGAQFLCFLGGSSSTDLDGILTNFCWVNPLCGAGPIYVLCGDAPGGTSGFMGNSSSVAGPTRGILITLNGYQHISIYQPTPATTGTEGFGTVECSPFLNLAGTTTLAPSSEYATAQDICASCDVSLSGVTITDCQNVLGVSYVTLSFTLDWSGAPPSENINVSSTGIPFIAPIDPSLVSPPITISTVPFIANGTTGNVLTAAFATTSSCFDTELFDLPAVCPTVDACTFGITATPSACIGSNYTLNLSASWLQNFSNDFQITVGSTLYGPFTYSALSPQSISIPGLSGTGTNVTVTMTDTTYAELNIYIIAYDPLTDYNLNFAANQCDEFIAIQNNSTSPIDISGYELFDQQGLVAGVPVHVFPAGTIIDPGEGLVLFTGSTPSLPIPFPFNVIFQSMSTTPPCATGVWDDSGDNAYLYNASNEIIDFATFVPDLAGIDTIAPDTLVCIATTSYLAPNCSPTCDYNISGVVYCDANSNATQQAGETGVNNTFVYLLTTTGVKIDSALTNASGFYSFSNLFCASYQLSAANTNPCGVTPLLSAAGSLGGTVVFNIGLTPLVSGAIELYQFEAVKNGKDVDLHWRMMNELRNTHAVVERSADGFSNFTPIASVASMNNIATLNFYNAHDNAPLLGYNYYRIRCFMEDGSSELSMLRVVNMDAADYTFDATVQPNPVNNQVQLSMNEYYTYTIKLYNSIGEIINQHVVSGKNHTMEMSHLAAGVYYIGINNDKTQVYKRVIKE